MADEPLAEERLADLLGMLPPAPSSWVEAAIQLPAARAQIDSIVERAEQDAAYRAEVLQDLERTLAADGVEPSEVVMRELARRLERARQDPSD